MKYVGARYMPKFLGTYDATTAYEALSVVDNGMGTSYVANKPVPVGTPLTDTDYWAVYGMSSGAILNLQQQINDMNDGTIPGSLQNQIDDNTSIIAIFTNMFNTVSNMIAADLSDDDLVKTKGYYAAEDGGGAEYIIKPTGTASYKCIQLTNGKYAHLLIKNQTVNIKQLGAHGDGVTDDSAIIQFALDDTEVFTVLVPHSEDAYIISSTLTLTRRGVTFKGVCYDRVSSNTDVKPTIKADGALASMLDMSTGYRILENLCFYGNGTALIGIKSKSSHVIYKAVSCVSCVNYGFELQDYMCILEQCNGYYCDTNFYIHGSSTGLYTSMKLIDCYSIDGNYGFLLEHMTYSNLDCCACDGADIIGYQIIGCRGVSMINCGSEHCVKTLKIDKSTANISSSSIEINGLSIISYDGTPDALIEVGLAVPVFLRSLFINSFPSIAIKSTSSYARIYCDTDIGANRLSITSIAQCDFPYMHKKYSYVGTVTAAGTTVFEPNVPTGITNNFGVDVEIVFGSRYTSGDNMYVKSAYVTSGGKLHLVVYCDQPQNISFVVKFLNGETETIT